MPPQAPSKKLLHARFASANITIRDADMAQLVEHHLAKVGVAGSNPVVRSRMLEGRSFQAGLFPSKCWSTSRPAQSQRGDVAKW